MISEPRKAQTSSSVEPFPPLLFTSLRQNLIIMSLSRLTLIRRQWSTDKCEEEMRDAVEKLSYFTPRHVSAPLLSQGPLGAI